MIRMVLLVFGIGLVGFGLSLQTMNTGVSAMDQARCEQIVRDRSGDSQEVLDALLPKCSEPGMVAMMDAQASGADAQSTGQSIAAANQGDLSANLLDWFLIGAGISALMGSIVVGRRRA